MNIPKYKILYFDRHSGLITINYEGYEPLVFELPTINGVYISGDDLDAWVRFSFPQTARDFYGVPRKNYDTVTGYEAIESIVDGTPFPVTHTPDTVIAVQPTASGFMEV